VAARYEHLRLEFADDDRVATLTVDRPEVRNALDGETIRELHAALHEVRERRSTVLILTGSGDKAFVSGADIRAIRKRRRDDALASINSRLFAAVEAHDAVTIAAVNGVALGGGCELALACDLRICCEEAVFGQPEPAIGIIPGAGATQRLPRIVGLGRAKEMILTGARWNAGQALAAGLVSAVVPREELVDAARAMADRVLALGPLAVRLSKLALNASSQMPLHAGLAYESMAQAITFESADKAEGTAAFLEKRKPRFTGE
jgi:enoyl-CoA hydratase